MTRRSTPSAAAIPSVEVRTMNKGRPNEFERVFLYCPNGHEGSSAPAHMRTAQRWLAGDYSGEWCGHTSCKHSDGYNGESIFGDLDGSES